MSCFAEMEIERCEREGLPEGFDAWCRIEDLCGLCGLDPAESAKAGDRELLRIRRGELKAGF